MIRGLSLFITILFLAGSAGAAPLPASQEVFWANLREVSGAGIRGWDGKYRLITEPQESKINIHFHTRNENGDWDKWHLTDLPTERGDPVGSLSARFDFDTILDCDPLGGTAFVFKTNYLEVPDECFDQAHTAYAFGDSAGLVQGLEVDFLHTMGPTDWVQTDGSIVFSLSRDITYIVSGSYGVVGNGIARLTLGVQLLERRVSEPQAHDTVSSYYEWFRLVDEAGGFTQTVAYEEFSNVEYTIGEKTECWGCPEGQNQYFGILKANTVYRIAWYTQVWRTGEFDKVPASTVVEPTGRLSFVVPEPSSNLMVCAGILGLAFLGRRRALAAKVS